MYAVLITVRPDIYCTTSVDYSRAGHLFTPFVDYNRPDVYCTLSVDYSRAEHLLYTICGLQ